MLPIIQTPISLSIERRLCGIRHVGDNRQRAPPSPQHTMIFGRLTLGFLLVSLAAFFCAQSVEAAKGPRITHKVYFDIKHGDKDLGRSVYPCIPLHGACTDVFSVQSFLACTAAYVAFAWKAARGGGY